MDQGISQFDLINFQNKNIVALKQRLIQLSSRPNQLHRFVSFSIKGYPNTLMETLISLGKNDSERMLYCRILNGLHGNDPSLFSEMFDIFALQSKDPIGRLVKVLSQAYGQSNMSWEQFKNDHIVTEIVKLVSALVDDNSLAQVQDVLKYLMNINKELYRYVVSMVQKRD